MFKNLSWCINILKEIYNYILLTKNIKLQVRKTTYFDKENFRIL